MSTYLYRFDVIALDDVITNSSHPDSWSASGRGRSLVHLCTNQELPESFNEAPFAPALIPPGIVSRPAPGWVFKPTAITHNELRFDSEANAGELSVELPLMHQVAQLYHEDPAGYKVWLTLARKTPAGDIQTLWTGRVIRASFTDSRCTLTCSHLLTTLARPTLTAKHPRHCGHSLYDESTCGVKPAVIDSSTRYFAYREDGWLDVVGISEGGARLHIPAAAHRADGFFDGGFIVIEGVYSTIAGTAEQFSPRGEVGAVSPSESAVIYAGFRHSIATHIGADIQLLTPVPASFARREGALRVSLFAGCDSSKETCRGKFNNYSRFGGYPLIPLKNSFATGIKKPKIV